MIKLMEMVHIFTLMELNMKDTGEKINKMDKVKKLGPMEPVIREIINKGKNLDTESSNGQMVQNMKVSSLKTTSMEKVFLLNCRCLYMG
jgi:cell fate (sporulation/competence/biofilm development) regulator YmcA (YheA/YmcA/DUF963 family)